MNALSSVERHYSTPDLYEIIMRKLEEMGVRQVTTKDLAAVDQFHLRGAAVSAELAEEAKFPRNAHVLDVGCGIGGAARMLVSEYGVRVTGIDITEVYIDTARKLSDRVGLSSMLEFIKADALDLPFPDRHFDVVWTQHVQMNIQPKQRFYEEIKRVLVENGKLLYYDIFSKGEESPGFPVPWASDPSLSYLFTKEELHRLLERVGFQRIYSADQTQAALDFLSLLFTRLEKEGLPPPGLHVLMGDTAKVKFHNVWRALQAGNLELESGCYQVINK